MAARFDRQVLRMLARDHARWILLVMVAGLLPLALGAFLLVREAGIDA